VKLKAVPFCNNRRNFTIKLGNGSICAPVISFITYGICCSNSFEGERCI